MTARAPDPPGTDGRIPDDSARLGDPLDFIHADHQRQRTMCATIQTMATAASPDADAAAEILSFLREEMPLHLADETEDLFPLLQRRCDPEDDIGKAIVRLMDDIGRAEAEIPAVVAILEPLEAGGGALSDDARATLEHYAALARSHITLERAIILPFARLRLTQEDLATLRLRMLKRRGLDRLMGPGNAR